jgi:aryl-alcohol dehydrogenase-like predicted oxidoreductase
MMTKPTDLIQLGKSEIWITPIGLGTWSWGDRLFWSYGISHSNQDVKDSFEASIMAGINFIDTAEIYGFGGSEKLLNELLKTTDRELIIASKLFPYPWRLSTKSLIRGLKGTLQRLGVESLDLYMMHWPLPPISVERWTASLVRAHEDGLIRHIGVSNYSLSQMRRVQEVLSKHKLDLAASQIHYSLLHHPPEKESLIQACHEDQVTVVAYSPLAQGLLTGKYTPESSLPKGMMRLGNRSVIKRIQPLIFLMRQIGERVGGKTPAQVAINWASNKGTVPIVGAKNRRQAEENLGSIGWSLTDDDVRDLEIASSDIKLTFPMEKLARS